MKTISPKLSDRGEIENLSKNLPFESRVDLDLEFETQDGLKSFLQRPVQQVTVVSESLKKYVSACHILMITDSL